MKRKKKRREEKRREEKGRGHKRDMLVLCEMTATWPFV
jgi:hypothetical protein